MKYFAFKTFFDKGIDWKAECKAKRPFSPLVLLILKGEVQQHYRFVWEVTALHLYSRGLCTVVFANCGKGNGNAPLTEVVFLVSIFASTLVCFDKSGK